ncbi:MAG: hypothetical protein R2806_08105 [Saprospiraceae bacterium]
MRTTLNIILFILLCSCSNELIVETEESRTPVVYGLLDSGDTLHFLRVEAALLAPGQSGPAAYVADSIHRNMPFFQITIEDESSGQSQVMERVLWTAIPGSARPSAPLSDYLYSTAMPVVPEHTYGIRIVNESGQIARGHTEIVEPFTINQPRATELLSLNRKLAIRWQTANHAAIDEVSWLLQIKEQTSSGEKERLIRIPLGNTSQISINVDGSQFYNDLANRLEVFPGTQRTLESLYLAVVAGTADYVELQQVLTAGQGITGIQSIPTYSNIEAGLGILTSRHVSKSGPYQLTEESLDSLKSGQYTKLLGF